MVFAPCHSLSLYNFLYLPTFFSFFHYFPLFMSVFVSYTPLSFHQPLALSSWFTGFLQFNFLHIIMYFVSSWIFLLVLFFIYLFNCSLPHACLYSLSHRLTITYSSTQVSTWRDVMCAMRRTTSLFVPTVIRRYAKIARLHIQTSWRERLAVSTTR